MGSSIFGNEVFMIRRPPLTTELTPESIAPETK